MYLEPPNVRREDTGQDVKESSRSPHVVIPWPRRRASPGVTTRKCLLKKKRTPNPSATIIRSPSRTVAARSDTPGRTRPGEWPSRQADREVAKPRALGRT